MTDDAPIAPVAESSRLAPAGDTSRLAPAGLSFADQVAAVDAIVVASRVATQGKRAALLTSTVEIVAMAQLLTALVRIADLTFDMLFTADALEAEKRTAERRAISDQVRAKIFNLAGELEALGYGVDNPTITPVEETNDDQKDHAGHDAAHPAEP